MQHSVTNNGCIAYLSMRMCKTGHIFTSGLKSVVTIVFFHSDFHKDAKNLGDLGQNREKVVLYWPERIHFYFWGFFVCAIFGENRSRNATVRVHADGQTQTSFISCPMLYAIAVGQIKICIAYNVLKTWHKSLIYRTVTLTQLLLVLHPFNSLFSRTTW